MAAQHWPIKLVLVLILILTLTCVCDGGKEQTVIQLPAACSACWSAASRRVINTPQQAPQLIGQIGSQLWSERRPSESSASPPLSPIRIIIYLDGSLT